MTRDETTDPSSFLPMKPRDYLVLFALLEGDRHGYGIVKEIEKSSGGTVTMDPSNLYRSVKRLIRIELVEEADLGKAPHSDEKRRHYRITPLGTRVVVAEAERDPSGEALPTPAEPHFIVGG